MGDEIEEPCMFNVAKNSIKKAVIQRIGKDLRSVVEIQNLIYHTYAR